MSDSRCRARIQRPLPHPGLEAPLRLTFRSLCTYRASSRCVAEGAERGLYLLDDPSRAVSDRGGSATQAPLPLARLWACFYLAVRAGGLWGRGSFCVEDSKVGRARQGERVEIGSDCRVCRR